MSGTFELVSVEETALPDFLTSLRDNEDFRPKNELARNKDLSRMQLKIGELNRFVADMDRIIEQVGDRLAPVSSEFITLHRERALAEATDLQAQFEYKQKHS